jgi:hypothetical protein
MTTKTHITAQEEGVKEVGIQIRNADPVSPQNETTWLNTTENSLKFRNEGETFILVKGDSIQELIGNTLECEKFNVFHKSINTNESFTLSNLVDGKYIQLFITNTHSSPVDIDFNLDTIIDNSSTLSIGVGKTVKFDIVRRDSIYVTATEFNT